MYCHECGSEVPQGNAFCIHCGARTQYTDSGPIPPAPKPAFQAAVELPFVSPRTTDEIFLPLAAQPYFQAAAEQPAIPPRKKRNLWFILGLPVLICALGVFFVLVFLPMIQSAADYIDAEQLMDGGDYEEAARAFAAVGDYRDAPERALEAQYEWGLSLADQARFDEAIEVFQGLGSFEDSADQLSKRGIRKRFTCWMMGSSKKRTPFLRCWVTTRMPKRCCWRCSTKRPWRRLISRNNDAALEIFTALGDYSDAAER